MTQQFAFLRAINVGGHVVKMQDLRELFTALGLARVETYIQSGNVIFEAEDGNAGQLERQIEDHLQKALGYPVITFVRSAAELAEIARYTAFPSETIDSNTVLYVAFLKEPPGEEARRNLMALKDGIHDFNVHQREVYWLRHRQPGDEGLSGVQLEKVLGMPATLRNMNTVQKMVQKYS